MRVPIYPEGLYDSRAYYSQGIRASGASIIYCSGQAATDISGQIVGRDIKTQCHQSLMNIQTLVESAGCPIYGIVRLNIYVVRHRVEYLDIIGKELADFFSGHPLPCSTLVAVDALARPEFLIEIEATAVAGID